MTYIDPGAELEFQRADEHVTVRIALAGPVPDEWRRWNIRDRPYRRRLLVRDGWGRQSHPFTRLAFYVRSHWLRMPPLMLARHLWTKAIKRH